MMKKLGKIQKVRMGFGGYQDAMFGLTLTMGSDKDSWGVGHFIGFWSSPPTSGALWTVEDQSADFAKTTREIIDLLSDAKVADVSDLVGTPVECTFELNTLKDWRILTEVV